MKIGWVRCALALWLLQRANDDESSTPDKRHGAYNVDGRPLVATKKRSNTFRVAVLVGVVASVLALIVAILSLVGIVQVAIEQVLLVVSAIFVAAGLSIWLTDHRVPGSRADLGAALVSGALVAFAVLAIQVQIGREAELRQSQRADMQRRISVLTLQMEKRSAALDERAARLERETQAISRGATISQRQLVRTLRELNQTIQDLQQ